MTKGLFDELESVREGGAILRSDEREAARTFRFEEPDVQRLRRVRLAKECAKLQRPE